MDRYEYAYVLLTTSLKSYNLFKWFNGYNFMNSHVITFGRFLPSKLKEDFASYNKLFPISNEIMVSNLWFYVNSKKIKQTKIHGISLLS